MKVVVIGHGVMGQHHARVLRELGHTIVTVDKSPGQGDLLDLRDTDATNAVIATPIEQLQHTAQQCFDLGIRVLLIEKPGAEDLRQATLLAAQHPDAAVGYVERHNPALVAMNQYLYRVGTVLNVSAERTGPAGRHPTDPAIDLLTHDLDALRFLDIPTKPAAYMNDGTQVNVLLESGTLTASYIHPTKRRTLRILGTEGELVCDYQAQSLTFHHLGGSEDLSPAKAEPLRRMWQAILERKLYATTIDAVPTLRTALTLQCHTHALASTATPSSHTAKAPDAQPVPSSTARSTTVTVTSTEAKSGES